VFVPVSGFLYSVFRALSAIFYFADKDKARLWVRVLNASFPLLLEWMLRLDLDFIQQIQSMVLYYMMFEKRDWIDSFVSCGMDHYEGRMGQNRQ
jgi:hypothetical protein